MPDFFPGEHRFMLEYYNSYTRASLKCNFSGLLTLLQQLRPAHADALFIAVPLYCPNGS